jgi:hypothetical protein
VMPINEVVQYGAAGVLLLVLVGIGRFLWHFGGKAMDLGTRFVDASIDSNAKLVSAVEKFPEAIAAHEQRDQARHDDLKDAIENGHAPPPRGRMQSRPM